MSNRFERQIANILEVMCALGRGELELDAMLIANTLDRVRVDLDQLGEELPASTVSTARYELFFDELEITQSQLAIGGAEQLHQSLQIIRFAVDDLRDSLMEHEPRDGLPCVVDDHRAPQISELR